MWGSLSGTIDRASHSLISHTKGARSTREVEDQQRLASLLLTASYTTGMSNRPVIVRRGQLSCTMQVSGQDQYSYSTVMRCLAELYDSSYVDECRVNCEG